jgi:hypothetical protein
MNIAPEAACVLIAATANNVLRRSIGFLIISMKLALLDNSFSAKIAAWISAISSGTASGWGRIHIRDLRPSSFLSLYNSQRGDSGIKKSPTDMKTGTT